mmetsp:Transcript_8051/g.16989  ORF Transcript_8051/g.16989 Transcript_8051/m.16989 type:complete len:582 (-) Transcript_8051:148-1893(-)
MDFKERNIKELDRLVISNGNDQGRLEKALLYALKPLSPGVLDLTRIPLQEERMNYALRAIEQSHGKIHKLILADCQLDKQEESFIRLCEFLRDYDSVEKKEGGSGSSSTLPSLDLSYNFLQDNQIDRLVHSIRENGGLVKQIRLRLIHLEGTAAGQCLVHLLKHNTNLQRLDISKNGRLGTGAHEALAKEGLAQNHHLEELDLGDCQLDDEKGALIIESLIGHPRMRRLRLSRNELGLESLKALARLLSYIKHPSASMAEASATWTSASKLRLLDLSHNPSLFGEAPMIPSLRNAVQQVRTGQEFEFEFQNNNGHMKSATAEQLQASRDFAQAVRHHATLRELNMSYCGLWGEVMLPLFQALQFNKSLRNLKLIGNLQLVVGDIDAAIGSGNETTTSAHLINSASETTTQLLASIARFSTLKDLAIDSGSFPQFRMRQLVRALAQNTTIIRVSTPSHPTISFKSPRRMNAFYSDLKQCIRKNLALQEILDSPDLPFSVFLPFLSQLGGSTERTKNRKEACSGNRRCDDIQDFGVHAQDSDQEVKSSDLSPIDNYNMKATFVYQLLQVLLPTQFQAYATANR